VKHRSADSFCFRDWGEMLRAIEVVVVMGSLATVLLVAMVALKRDEGFVMRTTAKFHGFMDVDFVENADDDNEWKNALSAMLASVEGPEDNKSDHNNTSVTLLYVTTHGGNEKSSEPGNNVRVYLYEQQREHHHHWTNNGLAFEPQVVKELKLQNLRGMTAVGDALFVASAHSSRSKIVVSRKCEVKSAKTFVVNELDHPYGLAFNNGKLFASNQNSNKIVQYDLTNGFGAKGKTVAHVKRPRGIAFDWKQRLWVASTKEGVQVFSIGNSARLLKKIKIHHAIGIAMDLRKGVAYVGSKDKKRSGVFVISIDSMKPIVKLVVPKPFKMTHPAGLALIDERLLVIAQDERVIYAFDTNDASFHGVVMNDLPKRPEALTVLRCNSTQRF